MTTHNDRRNRIHTGLAAAAVMAAVLAGTAACTGSSTPSAGAGGTAGTTTSSSPSSAGTITSSSTSAGGTATSTATGTGAGSGSTAGTTTAGNAGTGAAAGAGGNSACGNADIKVVLGRGGAAMSHDGQTLEFTNVSGHVCTLRGYPGVAVVASGKTLLNATRELNGYIGDEQQLSATPLVTLHPGQTASAELEWVANAGEPCYPDGAGTVLVTPPNTTASTPVRQLTIGSSGACANFQVHPVVAGIIPG